VKRIGSMNHLRLSVRDIPEAERFYDRLLGFLGYELVQRNEKRLAWAMTGPEGFLQWFILSLADPELRDREHQLGVPGFHHFAFNADSRDQVDRFHDLLVAEGADILDAPREYEYEPGYYAVFFRDPTGFKLEVVHVPQSTPLETISTVSIGRAP
jgi:glyoxylase I family protein